MRRVPTLHHEMSACKFYFFEEKRYHQMRAGALIMVPTSHLRCPATNSSQVARKFRCTFFQRYRPAWSVVLPGLRNACEATARGITRGEGRRARACTAKRAEWWRAKRVDEAGEAASLGWRDS